MRTRIPLVTALLGGALLCGGAAAAEAQDGFLFRAPQGQFTVRAGPDLPRAHGAVFDFITTELKVDRGDFRAPAVSGELALLLGSRWDLAVSLGVAQSTTHSDYDRFIGDDGLPIEQTTKLRTMPGAVTLRFQPLARGRTVSHLAWVPARTTPYIGGGAGVTWARLEQRGEFIEHETGDIFYHEYDSATNALTVHAVAGANHWFTPRIGLNLEGRYTRGSAELTGSYREFGRLDLSGVQASLGLSFRW
jgi:opacity protein-like surface antigen